MSKKESEKKPSRTISSRVANMAAAANAEDFGVILAAEMEKQREYLKMDMTSLINTSLAPIQASIANFQEAVDTLEKRVAAVENTAGDNFDALFKAEQDIAELKKLNATLTDRIDDLENRSRRVNVRIINVPEGSEKKAENMVEFVSTLLKDYMGDTFSSPPRLERAHRVSQRRPKEGKTKGKEEKGKASPRPIIVAFHSFLDRERVLHWAKQNEMTYEDHTVRFYPDLSAHLSKKRAAFKNVKAALYKKGIEFSLLHPARLRVYHGGETLLFETPAEAEAFYSQRIERNPGILLTEEILDAPAQSEEQE